MVLQQIFPERLQRDRGGQDKPTDCRGLLTSLYAADSTTCQKKDLKFESRIVRQ